MLDLIRLLALPVAVGGALVGADVSALSSALASTPEFTQVGQYGVGEDSAAEIIASDGQVLAYTNSDKGTIDFVSIADPSNPSAIIIVDVGGEPTSVAIRDGYAIAAVNTSSSFTNPSGKVVVIDMWDYKVVKEIPLAGQPDAVSTSPNGKFAAIAIENERDEDLNDGLIPQYPAGNVAIVNLKGEVTYADVRGLAGIAPSDPEPEFVDINDKGEIVVTLQENNHMVVLDSRGNVLSDFTAGTVDLYDIDDTKDGYYMPVGSRQGVRREPDAVAWIDDNHFVTANEGDYKLKRRGEHKRGGSRGFTIFHKDGAIVYDSGNTFENTLAEAGYWNDKRAEKKGVEPESVAVGTYNGKRMLFVGAERANAVGVYDISNLSSPVMTQILPTGKAPEGLLTLEEEGLFITSNEKDPVNSISIFKF
jgi:alkaline phosphatase